MRAQRIKTGFHRIGIVLATVAVLIGLAITYLDGWKERSPTDLAVAAVTGIALYALAFALGWIVAGFAGDRDEISN